MAGSIPGREALKAFLAHMHRNLEVTAFGPREVISQGNKAAAFGWFRLHSLSTSRTADISYSIFFELRDGLIVKYHFLENTFDVASAFRAGGAWLIDTDGVRHNVPAQDTWENPMLTETLSIQRFTSSEAGAWSNSYLISGVSDAMLFDVFMLRGEAAELAKAIEKSEKTLQAVMISHAHPDHFMGIDAIVERFPTAHVLSTANVVADIQQDGPWMFSMLQNKLGAQGPKRLIVPEPLSEPVLRIGGNELEVVEFAECESKHIASVYIPAARALLSADLVYNGAHLYVAEKHILSWQERLGELETFAKDRVSTIHPGHGTAGDLGLIAQTRTYLNDFAEAVKAGDGTAAEQQILAKYPEYHVRQFLTAFSIPAFFPAVSSA